MGEDGNIGFPCCQRNNSWAGLEISVTIFSLLDPSGRVPLA